MPKKIFNEKLNHAGDLPKVETLTNPRLIERYKTTTMAIAAHASEERGGKDETPWWRVLKKDGLLNEKYPDGVDGQKVRLEAEGHRVVQKGKKYFVEGYKGKCGR